MPAPVDRRLLRESAAARVHLALAGALGVLSAALHHATAAALRAQLIALGAVLLARAASSGAFELSGRLGAQRAMSELRARLARHLLSSAPTRPPERARTGELAAAAVQGVDALESWFAGYLPQLVLAGVVPVAVLAWSAWIDPISAAILAVTVPILIVFMVLIGKRAQAQTGRRWRALALLSAHFLDVVRGLPTLRTHRREHAQARVLADVGERYRRETMATLRVAFLSALVLELCATLGTALVAATVGVQLAGGYLSLTAGLTVLLLAPELYAPLRAVGQQFHASADGTAAAQRIFAVLDEPAQLAESTPSRPDEVARGARAESAAVAPLAPERPRRLPDPAHEPIGLERVGYDYPERPARALDGLELELAPGVVTALVGPSGAGKSTV
ncbi:MAG TPA: ABC transporter transmembrane domain-containing protein, partial [Solirubrobacteraceae bacterium]